MNTKNYFNKKIYLTNRISQELSSDFIKGLLDKIQELKKDESIDTDYLQVFEFNYTGNLTVEIEHRQEVPEYKNKFLLDLEKPLDNIGIYKIFVIDDVEHATILFAEEY